MGRRPTSLLRRDWSVFLKLPIKLFFRPPSIWLRPHILALEASCKIHLIVSSRHEHHFHQPLILIFVFVPILTSSPELSEQALPWRGRRYCRRRRRDRVRDDGGYDGIVGVPLGQELLQRVCFRGGGLEEGHRTPCGSEVEERIVIEVGDWEGGADWHERLTIGVIFARGRGRGRIRGLSEEGVLDGVIVIAIREEEAGCLLPSHCLKMFAGKD